MKLWTSWRWASSNLSSSRCILMAFESATWYLSVTSAFSLVRSTSLPLSSVNCEKRALFSTLNRSIRSALNKKEKKRKEKKRKEKKRKRVRPSTWKQKEQREKRGRRRRRGGLTFLGSCHFEATCFASLQRVSLLHAADSRLLSLFQRGAGKKCQTNENKRAKLEKKSKGKCPKGSHSSEGRFSVVSFGLFVVVVISLKFLHLFDLTLQRFIFLFVFLIIHTRDRCWVTEEQINKYNNEPAIIIIIIIIIK